MDDIVDERARVVLAAVGKAVEPPPSAAIRSLVDQVAALVAVTPTLRVGRERALSAPAGVRAWRRTTFGSGHDPWDVVIAVNTTAVPVDTGLVGFRLLSSVEAAPPRFDGPLLPHEAAFIADHTS